MTDNNRNATDQTLRYRSPQVKVIFVKTQGVLCQSGTRSMYEKNFGDGGFEEQ